MLFKAFLIYFLKFVITIKKLTKVDFSCFSPTFYFVTLNSFHCTFTGSIVSSKFIMGLGKPLSEPGCLDVVFVVCSSSEF